MTLTMDDFNGKKPEQAKTDGPIVVSIDTVILENDLVSTFGIFVKHPGGKWFISDAKGDRADMYADALRHVQQGSEAKLIYYKLRKE